MPGILELAHVVLGSSVRIAMPDYIGVRDPQYTTGVGLIKFAYRQAALQGKSVPVATSVVEPIEKRPQKQQPKQKKKEATFGRKVKKFFGYFFE